MGIMNMCWHENIILWDNSTGNREKKQKLKKKPLWTIPSVESQQTQHLNNWKIGCAGLTSWNKLMDGTVNSLLKTDVQV